MGCTLDDRSLSLRAGRLCTLERRSRSTWLPATAPTAGRLFNMTLQVMATSSTQIMYKDFRVTSGTNLLNFRKEHTSTKVVSAERAHPGFKWLSGIKRVWDRNPEPSTSTQRATAALQAARADPLRFTSHRSARSLFNINESNLYLTGNNDVWRCTQAAVD